MIEPRPVLIKLTSNKPYLGYFDTMATKAILGFCAPTSLCVCVVGMSCRYVMVVLIIAPRYVKECTCVCVCVWVCVCVCERERERERESERETEGSLTVRYIAVESLKESSTIQAINVP